MNVALGLQVTWTPKNQCQCLVGQAHTNKAHMGTA